MLLSVFQCQQLDLLPGAGTPYGYCAIAVVRLSFAACVHDSVHLHGDMPVSSCSLTG